MKNLGLLLLAVGVAVSASFGARLSPDVKSELAAKNKASVFKGIAADKKKAYCKAREKEGLPYNVNCEHEDVEEAEEEYAKKFGAVLARAEKAKQKIICLRREKNKQGYDDFMCPDPKRKKKKKTPVAKKEPVRAELLATAQAAYQNTLKLRDSDAKGEAAKAQDDWMAAEKAIIEPTVDAQFVKPTDPGLRLSQWFSESGIPFLGGLILVVIGAVLGRKAVRAEAAGSGGKKKGPEAVDFGQLIKSLKAEITALADAMGEAPEAGQAETVKSRIEALQFEAFEPIVEARGRIQVRFGIADYAELFSPFSSAERRINRSWSALVDNHWPEARDSMRIAAKHLAETETILDRLLAKG